VCCSTAGKGKAPRLRQKQCPSDDDMVHGQMTSEQNQKTRKASKNMTNIDKSIQIKSMSDFSNISLR
jgi:hypothetical protein